MLTSTILVPLAVGLDRLLGEPTRFHPLIAYGRAIQWVETRLYADRVTNGIGAVVVVTLPFVVIASVLLQILPPVFQNAASILILYLCIGHQSLREHAYQVRDALTENDLAKARIFTSYLVTRNTEQSDETALSAATCESVLENGADATLAPIFWFLVAGPLGVLLYRMANTLDASWGYRNSRYEKFGKAAARLDDLLNYVPARLTALAYSMAGNIKLGLQCWRSQGTIWKSPNAGPVMAAGAGALGLTLGGPAQYGGTTEDRPTLGAGRNPDAHSITACMHLTDRALAIWLTTALIIGGWLHVAA